MACAQRASAGVGLSGSTLQEAASIVGISRWRHWLKERVRAFNARGAHGAEIVEGREAQSNATPIWAPAGAKSGNLGGLSP
jgi:hypothetical protein